MLQIDRVHSEVDIVPGEGAPASAHSAATAESLLRMLEDDPAARRRVRGLVLEVLREELRELEQRGRL